MECGNNILVDSQILITSLTFAFKSNLPKKRKAFLNFQESLFVQKKINYCFGATAATGAVPGIIFTISNSNTSGEYGGIP